MSSNAPLSSIPSIPGSGSSSTSPSGSVLTPHSVRPGKPTSTPTVPFNERFSETAVARVVDYLAATDDATAELKANVQRTEHLAKLAEAFAYKSIAVGSVEDKKAEAKMQKSVQDAWDTHFSAIAAYEKARATRERGQMIFEGWRTASSNKRQGLV